MLNFQRTNAIVLRHFYLMRGSVARVLPLFIWVAIDMVLWGFITRYLNSVTGPGLNFIPMMMGPVLMWDFFIRIMQGVTTAFLEDVWSRNFLNLFATPLSISEYATGLVISSILTSLVGLAVMLALASSVFGLSFFAYGLLLVPFVLVLFLSGIALGILGCAVVLRFGPSSEWFVWPIPALISPFAAVFYPLSALPQWMHPLAWIVPPSHVFEGMRTVVAHGTVPGSELLTGVVLAVGYILLALWYFSHVYRRAVRTGLIARYSAETIS